MLLGLGDPVRELPREFRGPLPAEWPNAVPFCGGCLLVEGPPHAREPAAGERFAKHAAFADWRLVVLTEDLADLARASASTGNFLWTTFTRFDPARDLWSADARIVDRQLVRRPPLVLDARRKAHVPPELFCDPATKERVTRRWSEYFPQGQEMGDSDRGHLDPPRS